MGQTVEEFNTYRKRMNERLLKEDQKILKRVFNLDTNAYLEGHLPVKTKELLGLGNSLVLRCDDCVKYHLQTCFELGISKEEVIETMSISLVIGGTIVIPHLRRAVEFWDELSQANS